MVVAPAAQAQAQEFSLAVVEWSIAGTRSTCSVASHSAQYYCSVLALKTPATAQVFVWDAPLAASLLRQNSGLVATARFRSVVRSSAKRLAELSAQPARTAFQLSDAPILSADAPLHSRVESVLQSSAELKLSAHPASSKVAAPHLSISPSAALRSVLARRDAPNLAALQALCPASALAIPAQCVSSKSPRNGPALGGTSTFPRDAICGRAVSVRVEGVLAPRGLADRTTVPLFGVKASGLPVALERLAIILSLVESPPLLPAGRATSVRVRATACSCATFNRSGGRCGRNTTVSAPFRTNRSGATRAPLVASCTRTRGISFRVRLAI